MSARAVGALLVALSAVAFGTMPILGVWAYRDGTSTWALLLVRFGIAAVLLALVARRRRIRMPPLRRTLALSAMGGLGYVGQAYCYFSALQYAQASLVALLLYLYPAFVAVLAAVFLRERLSAAVLVALGLALSGTALVVGGGSGRPLGIALAVAAAVIYSVYITVGSAVTAGLDPIAVALVICTSATVTAGLVVVLRTVQGQAPSFPGSLVGWAAVSAIAVFASVVAILAFFAGLQRLGPTRTAVLSTLEPVVTVVLAGWLLAESMSPVQLLGGAVVVAAVIWQALARDGARDTAREPVLVAEAPTSL